MTPIFGLRDTDEQIDVLRARLLATRWPSYDSRDDWSLGTSSDDAKRLAQYWATQFDFDSLRQRLAALPHECVIIDDVTVPSCPCPKSASTSGARDHNARLAQ